MRSEPFRRSGSILDERRQRTTERDARDDHGDADSDVNTTSQLHLLATPRCSSFLNYHSYSRNLHPWKDHRVRNLQGRNGQKIRLRLR